MNTTKKVKASMEDRYKFYYDIGRLFNSSFNINFLLDTVLSKIVNEMNVEGGAFWLYDNEKNKAICSNCINPSGIVLSGFEIKNDLGIKGYCIRNRKQIMLDDINKFQDYEDDFERKMKLNVRSIACVPMLHKQTLIGMIELINGNDDPPFSNNDLELLEFISNTTAIALNKAHLFDDTTERERLKKELEFASFLQSSILPLKKVENPFFELHATLEQTKEMGGDFYDWRELEENKYLFLIADVSGKGSPAAIFMAIARSIMWTVSNFFHDPKKILEKTNEFLRNSNRIDMFVTTLLIVVDTKQKTLKYVSAGHNSGFLIRKNGDVVPLKTKGMPLGVVEKSTYEQKEISIEKDDLLFLYTDGLTETTNKNGKEYGEEKLERKAVNLRLKPLAEISENVFSSLNKYSNNQVTDDRCLMLLRFLEPGPKKSPMDSFALNLSDKMDDITKTLEYVERVAIGGGFSADDINDILIAVEEICVNVIMYGFPQSKAHYTADAWTDDEKITVVIKDKGIPFDPTRVLESPEEFNTKREEDGGYGLLLIRELMDEINYRYDDEKGNISTLIKRKTVRNEDNMSKND